MVYEEKTIKRENIYKGRIINVDSLTVVLPDGKEAKRDFVSHPGASVVVPLNADGELYLVRQFRKSIEKTTLELPAGKLDENEDPMLCAKRELKEETGLTAENIKYLISFHTTPGFCNEVLHMYLATGLSEGESCADEDEFISSEKMHVKNLVDMVLNHQITDAKTIIGVLLADKVLKGEISI